MTVMAQSPELELIDQLEGGDQSLAVLSRLFSDDTHAKRALANYVNLGVIELLEEHAVIPTWKSQVMLSANTPLHQYDNIIVSLTAKGAKAYADGTWDRLAK
jgi:hypothetical protein